MADETTNPPLPERDYLAIEAAVVETTRGRWFLAEYARRNRHADTTTLLAAIARLEAALDRPRADPAVADSGVGAVDLSRFAEIGSALRAVGTGDAAAPAPASPVDLARRLGGFAQDARDAAAALAATARDMARLLDGASPELAAKLDALAMIAELEQSTARRFARVGSDVIAAERALAAAIGDGGDVAAPANPSPVLRAPVPHEPSPALPSPVAGQTVPERPQPPALGPFGGMSGARPGLKDLKKMTPAERLRAMS